MLQMLGGRRREAVVGDAVGEERLAALHLVLAHRRLDRALVADEDEEAPRARDGGVQQVAVEHRAVLREHREHDDGVLGALRLVHLQWRAERRGERCGAAMIGRGLALSERRVRMRTVIAYESATSLPRLAFE